MGDLSHLLYWGVVATLAFTKDTSPAPQLFGSSKTKHLHSNAAPQDRFEVNLELVTVVGTEYRMQANLTHYEDIAELEDDILCFLPTVSELDVFGCELELLNLQTQRPLPEAFRTELLHRPQLQIVVRPGRRAFHLAVPG